MTSYVLTLIGNAESEPLEPVHIDSVLQCLELPAETDWLSEKEACDIFINSNITAEAITEKGRGVLARGFNRYSLHTP